LKKLFAAIVLMCAAVVFLTLPACAATVTSSFSGTGEGPGSWQYSYTVTPAPGEAVKDFHVYANLDECDVSHYYFLVLPAGWNFTVVPLPTACALTWWTTGDPLPVGVPAQFGYTHYCIPCCHSWILTGTGEPDPLDPPIDGSWNHQNEPCNIPPEYSDYCNGGGLVLAPRYPTMTPVESSTWGGIKALYR